MPSELGPSDPAAVPATAAAPHSVGYVDHLSFALISGWAWNPDAPEDPVSVEILDGDRVLLRIRCDMYRADLRQIGLGHGRHGFIIQRPADFLDASRHFIRIRRVPDGCDLAGGSAWIERPAGEMAAVGLDAAAAARLQQQLATDIHQARRPDDLAFPLAVLAGGLSALVNARLALETDKAAAARHLLAELSGQAGWSAELATMASRLQHDYAPLHFAVHAEPLVSLIIVAGSGFADTHACLAAVLAHTGIVPFEVLLVDDASTDETLLASLVLTGGIRFLRNPVPLGLQASRNGAAAQARGRHLLFLDRAARVTPDWLDTLLDTVRADAGADRGIGLVGSLLLDTGGLVWQCGAIVWRLGDIWRWGQGQPPDTPGLRHLRDTDLASSGASLMEASLFAELGGYDADYTSAPLAEIDLAFRVRARGLRVMVQPASRVIWPAAEQPVRPGDVQRLVQRWESPLASHRFTGEMPALEAERAAIKRALFVADTVPARDIGLPPHMAALLDLGFKLCFWMPAAALSHDSGLRWLERHGVECVVGHDIAISELIGQLNVRPELVYLQGLAAARHAEAARRALPRARIVCQIDTLTAAVSDPAAHDSGLGDVLGPLAWVDIVIVAQAPQAAMLRAAMPGLVVSVATPPIQRQKLLRGFSQRSGFACIGDFSAAHEVAAACRLADAVMPKLRSRMATYPRQAEAYLIGPHMPAALGALQAADLHIIGFVPVLADMLHRLRCTLAPPGGSAGIIEQRRVLDSFAHGLPCVIGSALADALELPADLRWLVADSDDEIADRLVALHEDAGLNARLAEAGLALIAERYDAGRLREALQHATQARPPLQLGFTQIAEPDGDIALAAGSDLAAPLQPTMLQPTMLQPGVLQHEIEYLAPGHIRGWAVNAVQPQRRLELAAHFAASGRTQNLLTGERRPYLPQRLRHAGFTLRWDPFADGFDVTVTAALGALASGDLLARASQAAPPFMPPVASRGVTVIIPVYGGLTETLCCLHSVRDTQRRIPYRVLIIDDCSPDAELSRRVAEFAAAAGFGYRRLAANLGFVASVNLAMAACPDDDVVLLNADTEVPDFWLDRLHHAAQQHPRIATVTPMSNNASIMSIPMLPGSPELPAGRSLGELDALCCNFDDGMLHDVPTAHGFCMYIRRDALEDVGLFDAELFGRGYGEENDFSLRARARGWRNVVTAAVFVRHVGSVSFSAGQSALLERNLALLNQRHPGYDKEVAAFIAVDPLRRCRARVQVALWRDAAAASRRPVVVMVALALPGGTMRHVASLSHAVEQTGALVLWVRSDTIHAVTLGDPAGLAVLRYGGTRGEPELLADLLALQPSFVHVHHVLDLAASVPSLLLQSGLPLVITAHDYFFGCPRVTLLEAGGQFCGAPDARFCAPCLDGAPHEAMHPGLRDIAVSGETWRAHWAMFLAGAFQVIVPSHAAATYMGRMFPEQRFSVRQHPSGLAAASRSQSGIATRHGEPHGGQPNRIAVIGAIGPHKGSALLHELVSHCHRHEPDLRFVIVGYTDRDDVLRRYSNVEITGKYDPEDTLECIAKAGCVAALFLSPWPETYCFTLSEALLAGLTPVGLDRGAIGERLRALGQGVVLAADAGVPAIVEGLRAAGLQPLRPILPPLSIDGYYPDIFTDYYAPIPPPAAAPVLLGPGLGVMADLWCAKRIELPLFVPQRAGHPPIAVILRLWNHDTHPQQSVSAWIEGAEVITQSLPSGVISDITLALPRGQPGLLWLRAEFDRVQPLGGGDDREAAATLFGIALLYADGSSTAYTAGPAASGGMASGVRRGGAAAAYPIRFTPAAPVPATAG